MHIGLERIKRMMEAPQHAKLGLKAGRVGLIGFGIKSSSLDAKNPRDIIVTANTDDVDLDDEVVVPGGADMRYYHENRANFIDHSYDFGKHVGSMRSIALAPDRRSWINRSAIFDGLKSIYADDLLAVARQAGIGASIGFESLDGGPPKATDPPAYQKAGFVIRKWRMVELSFTAMPCNVSCRTMHEIGGVDPEKMAVLDELVTKGRKRGGIELGSAIALGFEYRKVYAVSGPRRTPPVVLLDN